MKPIDRRVTDLVRESEKPHKSLEDRSPVFEPVELPRHRRRRGRLHHKVCPSRQLPAEIAQIREEVRLTRLVNLREKILQFLTTQYPTIEAAKGTHWYKVYNKVQDRIRLYQSAISDHDDIGNGLSALSL
jgi:hypothetical protein